MIQANRFEKDTEYTQTGKEELTGKTQVKHNTGSQRGGKLRGAM